jgi:hypothetical protein
VGNVGLVSKIPLSMFRRARNAFLRSPLRMSMLLSTLQSKIETRWHSGVEKNISTKMRSLLYIINARLLCVEELTDAGDPQNFIGHALVVAVAFGNISPGLYVNSKSSFLALHGISESSVDSAWLPASVVNVTALVDTSLLASITSS